ncbi:MAG: hypothetical protein COB02_09980 [Candidatus Cloacimonadota bacterium]|nr:MAG: hypothetical protein COB02_09980 [Candidatus Cloacimonadota bacterium]
MGIKKVNEKRATTLIELLIAITIIAIGIFPLLTAFSNVVASTIIQKDQISAITLAKFQMDLYLNQFQLIDNLAPDYPNSFTSVSPAPGVIDDGEFKESLYNESLFRIISIFDKDIDLSTNTQISYKINLSVWKIKNPPNEDALPQSLNLMISPAFSKGDERIIQLYSLYSQKNTIEE